MNKFLLLLVFILFQFSCNKSNNDDITDVVLDVTKTVQYKTLEGTTANLLSLDIYYTSQLSNLKPVVIYVHGGGWSIGDKTNKLENKIKLFSSLNYVFVSVNYRLSPFPFEIDNADRIKYPNHNNDIADAINWVYTTIEDFGGDKNKIVLLGHSAGAHLVSLIGTNSSFLESRGLSLSVIKGVATIDTEGYDVTAKITFGDKMYINAFGTNITSNNEASPIQNIVIGKSYPKFFVAKRGTVNRIVLSEDFANTLESVGTQVTQVNGSIYTHEEINAAIGAENETLITQPLKQFLENCFE